MLRPLHHALAAAKLIDLAPDRSPRGGATAAIVKGAGCNLREITLAPAALYGVCHYEETPVSSFEDLAQ